MTDTQKGREEKQGDSSGQQLSLITIQTKSRTLQSHGHKGD